MFRFEATAHNFQRFLVYLVWVAACSPSQFRIEVEFRLRGASDEKVTHNNTTVRATSSILEVSAIGRRTVHVSVNKALAVCDGFFKLLNMLRQRAQGKVRQRDAGQDIYFGRRNRCMIARS